MVQNLVEQQNRKRSHVKYTQNIYNQDSKLMVPRIIEKDRILYTFYVHRYPTGSYTNPDSC
jgi:hypothetical protein